MLQAAIDAEVDDFLAEHSGRRDEQGRRLVVRNGSLPEREMSVCGQNRPVICG
jgi:putative transposase